MSEQGQEIEDRAVLSATLSEAVSLIRRKYSQIDHLPSLLKEAQNCITSGRIQAGLGRVEEAIAKGDEFLAGLRSFHPKDREIPEDSKEEELELVDPSTYEAYKVINHALQGIQAFFSYLSIVKDRLEVSLRSFDIKPRTEAFVHLEEAKASAELFLETLDHLQAGISKEQELSLPALRGHIEVNLNMRFGRGYIACACNSGSIIASQRKVRIDLAAVMSIISNLVQNAKKAVKKEIEAKSGDADAVTPSLYASVIVQGDDKHILIRVTNYDTKVPDRIVKMIRGELPIPKDMTKGGVGLPYCIEMARKIGGTLTLERSRNPIFCLKLPRR